MKDLPVRCRDGVNECWMIYHSSRQQKRSLWMYGSHYSVIIGIILNFPELSLTANGRNLHKGQKCSMLIANTPNASPINFSQICFYNFIGINLFG